MKLSKEKLDKVKDKSWNDGHEAGFQFARGEFQDITLREFGYLAYRIVQDYNIDHEAGGALVYKLSEKVDEEKVRLSHE